MFIISWNVAGWSSTSRMIREDFGSIEEFLRRTRADIVCLQEVKGSWKKLEADPCGMGASDKGGPLAIDGWESFWSFSGKNHRGFNGVATFVRKGLTWWCDSRPFAEEELNDEGRVVITCHSAFVLVNTYVVNGRHGLRMAFKMRFLDSLKALLIRVKEETGKPIILVGDLNQTYRAEDAHWTFRRLDLSAVLQLCRRAQEAEEEEDKNLKWSQSFPWLSLPAVRRLETFIAEQVSLGLVATEEDKKGTTLIKSISVDSATYPNDMAGGTNSCEPASESDVALAVLAEKIRERQEQRRRNGVACALATLEELCEAGMCSVSVDFLTRSQPATHNRELFALTKHCGLPPHADVSVEFMNGLFAEMRLHDTLLVRHSDVEKEANPAAIEVVCPYTCWDQSRNARQRNEGTRIDYILIDEALVPALVPCRSTENNIGVSTVALSDAEASVTRQLKESLPFFDEFDGSSVATGCHRAMAGGAYPVASFDGSGLPPLAAHAKDVQFCGLPSTGLFVTPPQYSDHCGVCAFFDGVALAARPAGGVVERHRCQYRPPVGLHAFFAKRPRQDQAMTRINEPKTIATEGEKGAVIFVEEEEREKPQMRRLDRDQREAPREVEIVDDGV